MNITTFVLVFDVLSFDLSREYAEELESTIMTPAELQAISERVGVECYTLSDFMTLLNDVDDTEDSLNVGENWFTYVGVML